MSSVIGVIKGVYYDPFKWSIIKSIGVFAIGVSIALECRGVDFMQPISP